METVYKYSRRLFRCTIPGLALAIAVSSCQHEANEISKPTDTLVPVTFFISNYRQTSLDDITTEGGITRATGNVNVLAHLAVGVYDSNGKLYTSIEQNKGDENYGSFSLNIPTGKYNFVFLGYDGSHAVQLANSTNITFADDYVPNCFYSTLSITVDDAATIDKQIELSRCVGCYTLRCSNGITDDAAAMNYTVTGGGIGFNAMTGYASTTITRKGSIDFSSVTNRQSPITLNIYSFLPSEECDMTFVMDAEKQDGSIIRSRTFKDVPMKINQRVYYTGDFFADNTKFSLTLANADWDIVEKTF